MNKKTIYWLHSQLPSWKAKGWISDEVADEIMLFYSKVPHRSGPSLARLLILILGGILTALGIFLLFAGHWYRFSPNGRFDWSLALIFVALLVVAIAIWRSPRNPAFSEGATLFYMLALCGGTYLIGETYYLENPLDMALFLTLIASIPIIYALESSLGLFVYLLGTTLWVLSPYAQNFILGPTAVWLLLVLAVPFYISKLRKRHEDYNRLILLSWIYVAAIFSAVYITVATTQDNLNIFFMAALAACTYGIGVINQRESFWMTPFKGVGTVGFLYVVMKGAYISTWTVTNLPSITVPILAVGCLFMVLTITILKELIKTRQITELLICLAPIVVMLCHSLTVIGTMPLIISVLFNVYVILISIILFVRGGLAGRVGKLNGAFLILLALVLARFTDTAFTFVERGITFILVGVGLIAVNTLYMWNKNRKMRHTMERIEQNRKGRRVKISEPMVKSVSTDPMAGEEPEKIIDVEIVEPQNGKIDAIHAARAARDKEVVGFKSDASSSKPVLPEDSIKGRIETFSEFMHRQDRGGSK